MAPRFSACRPQPGAGLGSGRGAISRSAPDGDSRPLEVEPAVGLGFERTCDRLRKSLLLLVVSGLICGALTLVLQKKPDENRALLRAHESWSRDASS